ncbi:MAG: hypothetical protein HYZ16_06885 [Bacteroidetes bacterium]|jgi:hypothetical protein|nr:hypothetical protein [Bacteroidota bacterium]
MLLNVNGINQHLESYIAGNYEFRKNLVNKILGQEDLEYRRLGMDIWTPVSRFLYKEKRHILAGANAQGEQVDMLYPEWMIEKVAVKQTEKADEYIENPNLLKIIGLPPVRKTGIKSIRTSHRKPVDLQNGEVCYVCFGMKKSLFRKYYTALPALVEAKVECNGIEYYNVFIIKSNLKKNKVEYFGRHMVMNTEVGQTPVQAMEHVAFSQAIY